MLKQKNIFQNILTLLLICGIILGYSNFSQASSDTTSVGVSIILDELTKPIINIQIVDNYFMLLSGTTVSNGNVHITITGEKGYFKTVTVYADANGNWSYETEALNKDVYTVSGYVTDNFGHTSEVSDEKKADVKIKAPDFSVSVIGDGEIRIKSDGGTGFPSGTVQLRITGDGYSLEKELSVNGNGEWNTKIDSLKPGNYTIEIFTIDSDGNESSMVSHTFKIEDNKKDNPGGSDNKLPPTDPVNNPINNPPIGSDPGNPSVSPDSGNPSGESPIVLPGEIDDGISVLSETAGGIESGMAGFINNLGTGISKFASNLGGGVTSLLEKLVGVEGMKKTKEAILAGFEKTREAQEFINEELKIAAEKVDTPLGQTMTTVASASGVASIWSIISNAISTTAGNSFVYFGNSLILLFQSLRNRMRGVNNWGTVFESDTHMPIDFATVKIYSKDGKILDSVMTDKEGRFGFLVAEGSYSIVIEKEGFSFPSKANEDAFDKDLYQNIYVGGLVHFEAGQVINFNVPIDVQGKSLRESSREKIKAMSLPWKTWLKALQKIFFVLGFALALFKVVYLVSIISVVFVLIYVALILQHLFGSQKSYGNLIDKATGEPIPFAVVSIFHEKDPTKKIGFVISDMMGRIYRLIENGKYALNIKGKTLGGHDFHIKKETKVKAGLLNEKIEIDSK